MKRVSVGGYEMGLGGWTQYRFGWIFNGFGGVDMKWLDGWMMVGRYKMMSDVSVDIWKEGRIFFI